MMSILTHIKSFKRNSVDMEFSIFSKVVSFASNHLLTKGRDIVKTTYLSTCSSSGVHVIMGVPGMGQIRLQLPRF